MRRGELLAIIGPSGCGKSTLLNTLAHRLDTGLVYEGSLSYLGSEWNQEMKRRVGFVEQDDIVIPDLTVEQMLAFSAELRLPYSMSRKDKQTRIEGVVTAMRLGKTMETKIANISGGERKRVCIALELVASPEVLLMDEPTSGLDSTVAYKVVKYVKEVVSRGTSVSECRAK